MLVRQKALEFSPGEKFSYTNSGYFLLAGIVRRATGKSASTFLEQHIFEALGMEASRLHDELEVIYRLREHDGGLHLTVNAVSGRVRARAADHLRWSAGGADFLFTRDRSGAIEGFSLQSESVQGLRFRKLDCD